MYNNNTINVMLYSMYSKSLDSLVYSLLKTNADMFHTCLHISRYNNDVLQINPLNH